MDSPLFLVVDVGSSSVRALLFDHQAQLVPRSMVRHTYTFAPDATVDARALREQVEACIDGVLARYPSAAIAAVGMATFVGNMLGISADNQPLTPLYTYADTQSLASAHVLSHTLDEQRLHAATGCRIHTAYHPAKLHWLKQTQPEMVAQVAQWVDFATYCYRTWFGREVPCSYSVASWSGLLNRITQTWEQVWLDYLGLDSAQLPVLADYDHTVQGLSSAYAARWHALRDTPFYLAVGDGVAANAGSLGSFCADVPVLTIGTTAAVRKFCGAVPTLSAGLWLYRLNAQVQLMGGATSEGGNIFAWAKQHLRLPKKGLDEKLLAILPQKHPLVAIPLFGGERSPNYRVEASGTLHGITFSTSALDVLHALMVGVAIRLRLILDQLSPSAEFVVVGGGAINASKAWQQIIADVVARPLQLSIDTEATARGVALLITGLGTSTLPPPESASWLYPRPEVVAHYAQLREQHERLYNMLYQDTP